MKSAIIDKYRNMSPFTVRNCVCLRMKSLGRSRNANNIGDPDHVMVYPKKMT